MAAEPAGGTAMKASCPGRRATQGARANPGPPSRDRVGRLAEEVRAGGCPAEWLGWDFHPGEPLERQATDRYTPSRLGAQVGDASGPTQRERARVPRPAQRRFSCDYAGFVNTQFFSSALLLRFRNLPACGRGGRRRGDRPSRQGVRSGRYRALERLRSPRAERPLEGSLHGWSHRPRVGGEGRSGTLDRWPCGRTLALGVREQPVGEHRRGTCPREAPRT